MHGRGAIIKDKKVYVGGKNNPIVRTTKSAQKRVNALQRAHTNIHNTLTIIETTTGKGSPASIPQLNSNTIPVLTQRLFTGGWVYDIFSDTWSLVGNTGDVNIFGYTGYARSVPDLSIYINGDGSGIWITEDHGGSWTFKVFPGIPASFVDLDVSQDKVIWLTIYTAPDNLELLYSEDLGDTWITAENLAAVSSIYSSYGHMAVDPNGINGVVLFTLEYALPTNQFHIFVIDKSGNRTAEVVFDNFPFPDLSGVEVGWKKDAEPIYGVSMFDSASYPDRGSSSNTFYRKNGSNWDLLLIDTPTGANYHPNAGANIAIQDDKIWLLMIGNFNGDNRFYEDDGETLTILSPPVLSDDVGETWGIKAYNNEYYFKSDVTFWRGDGVQLSSPGGDVSPFVGQRLQVLR